MARKNPASTGIPGGDPKVSPAPGALPGTMGLNTVSPFYKGSLPNQMKKGHPGGN